MTSFNPGDVVLVPFPFSDLSGVKKRPALLLAVANKLQEMVCLMLTSLPGKGVLCHSVASWKAAGLLKHTTARLHRIFTIDRALALGKLGKIDDEEYMEILAKVVTLLERGRF
ncbi:PemK-like protein [Pelotomaculum schinkii]|uniref:PemK-like protein n=1 Tax=Pelotomaculum schinkii TaxID=78350 RepID=A0A4Y7R7D8_9FIRM|nr:type II toxin-antitoxin system PemK/MazF family toxin [Pelotomaculum schinkii]TEB04757.1 PemK-like protein [Pelotomaculum schinkii]